MLTEFSLLQINCGLSHIEAAAYLKSEIDMIESWGRGEKVPPARILSELRKLSRLIERVSTGSVSLVKQTPRDVIIELGYAIDDHDAQLLGWPCVGAHQAVLARVVARLPDREIKLVPCGSTLATADAAAAHGKKCRNAQSA